MLCGSSLFGIERPKSLDSDKRRVPAGSGTLPTDTALFGALTVFVILIVGALTFLPALTLGPVADHLQMLRGVVLK